MKAIKNIATCLGVSWACLMLAGQAAYAGVAGHAQFVNGSVQIVNVAGQTRTLQKGAAVSEGDTLISAKGASAQIKMQDGGFIAVRPDTQLKFDSFKFSGKADGSEESFFSLFKGGFRAVTGLIGRINKNNYHITTPASTIGIRGTDHETFVVTPDSQLANAVPTGTYNKVNVGETYMTTDKGTIFVLPNQMGFAAAADQIPQVQPLNINLFTVADKPAKEAKSEKDNGEKVRETAAVDNTAKAAAAPATVTTSSTLATTNNTSVPQQPITTTNGTSLSGGSSTANTLSTTNALPAQGQGGIAFFGTNANKDLSNGFGGMTNYTSDMSGLNTFASTSLFISGARGTASVEDTGSFNLLGAETMGWGRWVGPGATVTYSSFGTMAAYNLHYVGGSPVPLMPITGVIYYVPVGGTRPSDSLGNLGQVTGAIVQANLASGSLTVGIDLSFGGVAYSASGSTTYMTNGVIPGAPFTTVGCTPGCISPARGDFAGAFIGTGAAGLGLVYHISSGVLDIAGAQAFTAQGSTSPVVVSAAYTPSNFLVELSSTNFGFGNYMVAPADMTYTPAGSGNLSSIVDRGVVGLTIRSTSVIGGVTPITGMATSGTTGIQFGRWTSASSVVNTMTSPLGISSERWVPNTWMYGPQGYLDTGITGVGGKMYGTFTYALDGGSAPYDNRSRMSGTLTSASISANFVSNLISANLALTVGGVAWSASATNMSLLGGQFNAFTGAGGNLAVSMGVGAPVSCPTCSGNLNGSFTGQNYAGTILSYNLSDSANAGWGVSGEAAFARTGLAVTGGAITNGIAAPTGKYVVAANNGSNSIQIVDSLNNAVGSGKITPGGVLTAYSVGSPAMPPPFYYWATSVTCTACTSAAAANATTAAAPTGIYFGTWNAGSFTQTYGMSTGLNNSPYWISGPEAGPLFLANALVGTKTFSFDGGMVTNSNGVAGTVSGTTALTVDFTRQVVGINLDLSVPGTQQVPVTHTWNAKTTQGNEAVINGGSGIGGASFYASSYTPLGPGRLTVTVDGGVTTGNGTVSGQLTGTGLNGAILSYNLNAIIGSITPTFEQVNGVTALFGPASPVATAHRGVMVSSTQTSALNTPTGIALGFYQDAPARMSTDAAGNLTQFDMEKINKASNNIGAMTLASGTSTPGNAGTDPLTGISWGRWVGGSINVTDRTTGVVTPQAMASSSLHWIAGPTETTAVTLPVSGSYIYTNAGGTAPTDNLGNIGTLNSATLSANFTARTVNAGVSISIAGSNMTATASNVPIIQQTAFYADSTDPLASATHLAVTCTGTCGTSTQGIIVGEFSGAGATGAMMTYGLENIGANTQVISGVAAFHR